MYDTSPDIASLISARICHDIASPLGAIANGLELLELSGIADSPETLLIGDSVASATARVEFFRVAYGIAGQESCIGASTASKTLVGYFDEKKITADWSIEADTTRTIAKLLFLLAQSAESAMPYGGNIQLTSDAETYQILCTAREIRIKPELWDYLSATQAGAPLNSSQVQFALAQLQARSLGRTISYDASPEALAINVT